MELQRVDRVGDRMQPTVSLPPQVLSTSISETITGREPHCPVKVRWLRVEPPPRPQLRDRSCSL